jgi:adenylate kinase
MNITLLGPSGAGKGTQAALLCQRFGLRHLSTGDLLRDNLERKTALGILIRKYMDQGEFVPDEVVQAMIEEALQTVGSSQGMLFDSFPATPEQASFLDELFLRTNRKLDAVIYLHVTEADVVSRLGGRLVCSECHATFHRASKPPARANICDRCGGTLQTRADDNDQMARKRLRVFQRHVGPVLDFFQRSHRLHLLNGSGSVEDVSQGLMALADALQNGKAVAATADAVRAISAPAVPEKKLAGPARRERVLNLVLLGGPGSGKGTQAEKLRGKFQLCHIASGDLFRQNLKDDTRLGQLAKTYMNRGELVPDDITEAMVEERLARADASGGFLLDGFPRTLPQARALAEMLQQLNHPLAGVLCIQVSDQSLVERLSGRWICRVCQTPFHLLFNPPVRPGVCDKCGGELYQRDDDKPDTVRARLRTFHKQTEPLIEYYQQNGLLWEIDGEGEVTAVSERASTAIEKFNTKA